MSPWAAAPSRPSRSTPSSPTASPRRWSRPAATIEWMCLPRMDGPSVFGAILDRDAGHFRVGPADVTVPGRPPLPARGPTSWRPLGHRLRLVHRARRAVHRAVAPRDRPVQHPPPVPHRLRRRPRAAAHDPLRQRLGGDQPRLRAEVRLRAQAPDLGVLRGRLPRVRRDRRGRRPQAQAHLRPAHRLRGLARPGTHPAARRRHRLRGAVVVRSRGPADLRRGLRAPGPHRGLLARVAGPRRLPRPPVEDVPPAQRADAQGPQLRPDRRDGRGVDHVAARDPGRRAQLGLPLQLGPRLDVHALGAVHARLRLGGQRLLLLHRRRRLGRARAPDHVRHRRRARAAASTRSTTSTATRAPSPCASATARSTSASTTSGARCWTRSTCTRSPATTSPRGIWEIRQEGRGVRHQVLEGARSRDLGGPRRAQALHALQDDVLGRLRPRSPARPHPRGQGARGRLAGGRRRDPRRHLRQRRSTTAACSSSTTAATRSTPPC